MLYKADAKCNFICRRSKMLSSVLTNPAYKSKLPRDDANNRRAEEVKMLEKYTTMNVNYGDSSGWTALYLTTFN